MDIVQSHPDERLESFYVGDVRNLSDVLQVLFFLRVEDLFKQTFCFTISLQTQFKCFSKSLDHHNAKTSVAQKKENQTDKNSNSVEFLHNFSKKKSKFVILGLLKFCFRNCKTLQGFCFDSLTFVARIATNIT